MEDLLSLSLDRLEKEPELLASEAKRLQGQLLETTSRNCDAFLASARSAEQIEENLASVSSRVTGTVDGLGALAEALAALGGKGGELLDVQGKSSMLYRKVQAVQPLLEIPQLIDACIRAEAFDEALDLQAYVGRLGITHGSKPAVRALQEHCDSAMKTLLARLIRRLSGPLHLAECLRAVGYLKRLAPAAAAASSTAGKRGSDDAFAKLKDLRVLLLECRERWLEEVEEDLDPRAPYEYAKRLTEHVRLHLFDIATQYSAVFPDEASSRLLSAFMLRHCKAYLSALQDALPRVNDAGSLAGLLDHAMYCGASLARVGCDFRPLLEPIFEAAIAVLFKGALAGAEASFASLLAVPSWGASGAGQASRDGAGERGADADGGPSMEILEFPFLAALTNGVLAALNVLRQLPAPRLMEAAAAEVSGTLGRAYVGMREAAQAQAIDAAGAEAGSGKDKWRAAERCLSDKVVPHITKCFGELYAGGAKLVRVTASGS